MAIVTLSDALIGKGAGKRGTVLRDKRLCGLCLRIGARTQTFVVATSSAGMQVRVTLGRWPLITVDQAREMALPILRRCRAGEYVLSLPKTHLPTLREALTAYAEAKKVKTSSLTRYHSLLKTHFVDWFDKPVSALRDQAFVEHCHRFAQNKGAALVDLGRGIVGSILKYVGAVYGVEIPSPFVKLGAAGLMPERPQPRARKLAEHSMKPWLEAVATLPALQRDYLRLVLLTGLRKKECSEIRRIDVDLDAAVLQIPETKGKKPHSLPITKAMREILERRCQGVDDTVRLFEGLSADHVTEMAERAGAPTFTLHDLRKLVASVGAGLGVGDAILRRILGHAPKLGDTLHRHYVQLSPLDVLKSLAEIQAALSCSENPNALTKSSSTSPRGGSVGA